jgi:hypothetical protein
VKGLVVGSVERNHGAAAAQPSRRGSGGPRRRWLGRTPLCRCIRAIAPIPSWPRRSWIEAGRPISTWPALSGCAKMPVYSESVEWNSPSAIGCLLQLRHGGRRGAIHAFTPLIPSKSWMAGTRPARTWSRFSAFLWINILSHENRWRFHTVCLCRRSTDCDWDRNKRRGWRPFARHDERSRPFVNRNEMWQVVAHRDEGSKAASLPLTSRRRPNPSVALRASSVKAARPLRGFFRTRATTPNPTP